MAEYVPHDADLFLKADYTVDDPLWGPAGPVTAEDLGISSALTERLRAWNGDYGSYGRGTAFIASHSPGQGSPVSPERFAAWLVQGERLAAQLQRELPLRSVSYIRQR